MSPGIAYRPDVDGLRAVAVLSVMLCHFGVPFFAGGYVGVDVFFVISGFLITSIVMRDIDAGTFTVAKFYERRARRILPAFLLVALTTALGCLALFLPEDLLAFGKSMLASAVFSTNLLFWQEGGYFAAPSELKPLLHTWSLSIEEQFYVFLPLLLSSISRRAPRSLKPALGVLLALSLLLCVWATGRREMAFYVLPTRAWELLVGALLAVAGTGLAVRPLARALMGAAGLLAVLACTFAYSNRTLFPGLAAVVPCLGAAAIISSGPEHGPVARWLSSRPVVFVGKISYSLYLWHWPLLVLVKYYTARRLTGVDVVGLLATTFALATLSWRFVETPFRRGTTADGTTARVLRNATLTLAGLAALGAVLIATNGLPQRVPSPVLALAQTHSERDRAKPTCVARILRGPDPAPPECRLGQSEAAPSFALWGDSHAAAVSGGVASEATRSGRAGVLLSKVGCPPLVDTDIARGFETNAECRDFAGRVLRYLQSNDAIKNVLIVGRWSVYVRGQLGGDGDALLGADPLLLNAQRSVTTAAERGDLLKAALQRTVERLQAKGKRAFLSDPVPEIGWDVPMTLARVTWFHGTAPSDGPSKAEYLQRNDLALEAIGSVTRDGSVTRLSPQALLCPAERCRLRKGASIFYADGDHVSRAGGSEVAPAFRVAFND